MAQQDFPWSPQQTPSLDELNANSTKLKSHWYQEPLKKFIPFIGFGFLLVALFATKALSSKPNSVAGPGNYTVDVLIPMVPISKGSVIPFEALQQIPLDKRDLTKPQMLQVLRPQDLENLRGKLRAKKDLAPHRPLFWNDLMLKSAESPLPSNTHILYSTESK